MRPLPSPVSLLRQQEAEDGVKSHVGRKGWTKGYRRDNHLLWIVWPQCNVVRENWIFTSVGVDRMLIIVKDCVVSVTICTLNQQFPFSTNPWVGYLAALAWPWLPQLFIRLIPLRFWGVPVDETKMVTYSFACRSTGSYWERFERLNAFNSSVPHLTWNVRSPSSQIRPLGGARRGTVVLLLGETQHPVVDSAELDRQRVSVFSRRAWPDLVTAFISSSESTSRKVRRSSTGDIACDVFASHWLGLRLMEIVHV